MIADNYGDNSMAVLSEVQFFGVGTYVDCIHCIAPNFKVYNFVDLDF